MDKHYRFACKTAAERSSAALGRYVVVVSALDRSVHRLTEDEYALASLFDGTRSPESVLALYRRDRNIELAPEELAEFIGALRERNLLDDAEALDQASRASGTVTIGAGLRTFRHALRAGRRSTVGAPDLALTGTDGPEARHNASAGRDAVASRASNAETAFEAEGITLDAPATRAHQRILFAIPVSGLVPVFRSVAGLIKGNAALVGLLAAFAACLFGLYENFTLLSQDLVRLLGPWTFLPTLLPAALLTNLLVQLLRLGAISRHTPATPRFGVALALNVIPSFHADTSAMPLVSLNSRREIVTASLNAKLLLFVLGSTGWLMTLGSGNKLHLAFLALMGTSAFALSMSLNPLAKREAYFLLAMALRVPGLYERALQALLGRQRTVDSSFIRPIKPVPRWVLVAYGIAILTYLSAVGVALFWFIGRPLEAHLGGLGVVIFVAAIAVVAWHPLRRGRRQAAVLQRGQPADVTAPSESRENAPGMSWLGLPAKRATRPPRVARIRILLAGLLLVVLFLPYTYETSGNFEILAPVRQQVNARIAGEIAQVHVRGGEHVKANQILASLDSHDQQAAVTTSREQIAKQKATLEALITTRAFRKNELVRTEQLFREGYATPQDYEQARTNAETSADQVVQAEAELRRLEEQLRYNQEELDRTVLRMPFDGQVVTTELDKKVGSYLREGDLFAIVENVTAFQARVEIPEADAGKVEIGGQVNLKAWAYPFIAYPGRIRSIDPVVVQTPYGRVVNVYVDVNANQSDGLKSGMTGVAKVEAGDTLVAVAYTRMLVRFFLIELWSWIP